MREIGVSSLQLLNLNLQLLKQVVNPTVTRAEPVQDNCLSVHSIGQNINLPVCVSVCTSHFLSTRLQVRSLNGFLQLMA